MKYHLQKSLVFACCFFSLFHLLIAQQVTMDWSRQLGGQNGVVAPMGMAPTPDGGMVAVGWFEGTVDLDPGPTLANQTAIGQTDAFVIRMDSMGNRIWLQTLGAALRDSAAAVRLDMQGNIVVAGTFSGNVDFDPGPGTQVRDGGTNGFFCQKLDPAGNLLWVMTAHGTNGNAFGLHAMDLDPQGNVYISSDFEGTYDFDPLTTGSTIVASSRKGYLWKISATGQHQWVQMIDGLFMPYAMDVDGQGNVHLTGIFDGSTDFDPGPGQAIRTAIGDAGDAFAAKYDANGALQWVAHFENQPAVFWTFGTSIVAAPNGTVYLTGLGHGSTDFDPSPTSTALISGLGGSRKNAFILKLDRNGNFLQLAAMEGATADGVGIALTLADDRIVWLSAAQGWADLDMDTTADSIAPNQPFSVVMGLDTNLQSKWAEPLIGVDLWYEAQAAGSIDGVNILLAGVFHNTIETSPRGHSDSLTAMGNWDGYLVRWHVDTCAGALAVIDNESPVGCGTNGTVVAHAEGGNTPFSFLWNTVPPTTTAMASISQPGMYTLTVTDYVGCVRTRTVAVAGPTVTMAFEYEATMVIPVIRAGQLITVPLHGRNNGCITDTGQVRFTIPAGLSYAYCDIAPDSILGNTLVWNHDNLIWLGPEFLNRVHLIADSSLIWGQMLCFDLAITPLVGDPILHNNQRNWCVPVQGSFDPNDLQVQPRGHCDAGYVLENEPLVYTIRFQNTGNAEAYDIHIEDSIGPYMDLASLRVLAQSHAPMITEVLPGNRLDFRFDNIHLPDSNTNEPASHGYVVFELSPLPGLPLGTEIHNRAGIYFDFNAPVPTNAVHNTLTDTLLGANASFVNNAGVLQAQSITGSYQWMSCGTAVTPITGATSPQFSVLTPGSYALQVNDGGCTATSPCFYVATVGSEEWSDTPVLHFFPNPSHDGQLHIAAEGWARSADIQVMDMQGRMVGRHDAHLGGAYTLQLPDTSGLYLVRVVGGGRELGKFKVLRQ